MNSGPFGGEQSGSNSVGADVGGSNGGTPIETSRCNSPVDDKYGRKRTNTVSSGGSGERENKRPANKVCRVCGDKAYSYNFNVITCESCKAFFRRNAIKEREARCPFNNQCEVTLVSRRFCQRCRLAKCFRVGMKKEWIMSDEARLEKKHRVNENRERRLQDALTRAAETGEVVPWRGRQGVKSESQGSSSMTVREYVMANSKEQSPELSGMSLSTENSLSENPQSMKMEGVRESFSESGFPLEPVFPIGTSMETPTTTSSPSTSPTQKPWPNLASVMMSPETNNTSEIYPDGQLNVNLSSPQMVAVPEAPAAAVQDMLSQPLAMADGTPNTTFAQVAQGSSSQQNNFITTMASQTPMDAAAAAVQNVLHQQLIDSLPQEASSSFNQQPQEGGSTSEEMMQQPMDMDQTSTVMAPPYISQPLTTPVTDPNSVQEQVQLMAVSNAVDAMVAAQAQFAAAAQVQTAINNSISNHPQTQYQNQIVAEVARQVAVMAGTASNVQPMPQVPVPALTQELSDLHLQAPMIAAALPQLGSEMVAVPKEMLIHLIENNQTRSATCKCSCVCGRYPPGCAIVDEVTKDLLANASSSSTVAPEPEAAPAKLETAEDFKMNGLLPSSQSSINWLNPNTPNIGVPSTLAVTEPPSYIHMT